MHITLSDIQREREGGREREREREGGGEREREREEELSCGTTSGS